MSESYGFNVCRVCLYPAADVHLTSLFEDSGYKAKVFMTIAEFNVSWHDGFSFISTLIKITFKITSDEDKHSALICEKCWKMLEFCYLTRRYMRDAEKHYFRYERKERHERTIPIGNSIIKEEGNVFGNETTLYEDFQAISDVNENAIETIVIKDDDDESVIEHPANLLKVKCTICDKKMLPKSLRDHINVTHKNIKRFACNVCLKTFYQKSHLGSHIMSHVNNLGIKKESGNTYDEYRCDIEQCDKVFGWKSNLKRHQMNHHKVVHFPPPVKLLFWFTVT
jgi:hypothetical protein